MGSTLWRGRDLMVIGPSYDSACHAQGQLPVETIQRCSDLSGWCRWPYGLASACAVSLAWVPHYPRQARVPCAIGGRRAVLSATGTPATASSCAIGHEGRE